MKTFVVATDFSSIAENAVEYACALAQQVNASVVLYNSFSLPVHAANARLHANDVQKLMDNNERKMQDRAKTLADKYNIEVTIEIGFLTYLQDELVRIFKDHGADLLIMGMASSSLEQDLIGNSTTSAISKLKHPVLAIPHGAKFNGINQVLFACDILKEVNQHTLDRIKQLAVRLGATVEVFSVNKKLDKLEAEKPITPGQAAIDQGLEGVRYYYKNVASGALIEELKKEIIALKADLLIMLPNKYGFWGSLVHRSKTRIMASGSDIPLLSIPLQ